MSDDADRRPDKKAGEKANKKAKDKMSKGTSCEEVRENVDSYLDGELAAELPADAVAAFEAHLASCEECLALLERRKALVGLVGALTAPKAPAGLAEKILAASVRGAPAGGRKPSVFARLRTWAPAFAAAAVLLFAVVIGLNAPREERAPDGHVSMETAREAESTAPAPAPASRAERRPSLDMVAAKAEEEAPREALVRKAVAGRRRGKGAGIETLEFKKAVVERTAPGAAAPVVAMKRGDVKKADVKKVDRAVPTEPAAARDAARVPADGALPAVADAIRFEKNEAAPAPAPALPPAPAPAARAPADKRLVRAKSASRGRVASKSASPTHLRSARRANGERYRPRAAEQVLGGREDFDEGLAGDMADEMAQVGRSIVVPQVSRIARQAFTGPGRRERETGRLVLSRVVGGETVARIPIATPDALATQGLIVTLAHETGGVIVARISPAAVGPGARQLGGGPDGRPDGGLDGELDGGFALSVKKARSAGDAGQRPPAAPERTVMNALPFTVEAYAGTVVVQIPGFKAERFLRKIDDRFGDVEVEYATVLEETGGLRRAQSSREPIREPRRVYRAVARRSVLEKLRENLPDLRRVRLVTIEFPLISPAELVQIEAAEAEAERANAAARVRVRRAPTEKAEAAKTQSEPAPADVEAEQSPAY